MKKNERITLFVIVALGILVGFYYLLTPQIERISFLRKNITQKKAEIQRAKNMIAKKPQLEREFQAMQELIEEYQDRMPGEDKIPAFLSSLTDLANEHKINVMYINPCKVNLSKGQVYAAYPIKLGIEGGYHQIARFVNALENLERFVKISKINLVSNDKNNLKHETEIYLSIFIFSENDLTHPDPLLRREGKQN